MKNTHFAENRFAISPLGHVRWVLVSHTICRSTNTGITLSLCLTI